MSKYVFRMLPYLLWILVAFLFAFGYMRIILGAQPASSTGFMKMFDWVYGYAFVSVGAIIASIIALLFILIDVFYLNKKLKNTTHPTIIRWLIIMTISIIVGASHYILEKVVDLI